MKEFTAANWERVKLGELCKIARGGSPRPIKKFITTDPDGVNWIKIGDAQVGGRFIESTKEKITRDGISRSRFVEPGAFLLSNSMSFGRPYILKTSGCIHDGWLVLEPDYKRVHQDFLYHILGAPETFQQFDSLAAGSTVRNLNIGLVESVSIPLPPLEEQQRIVAVLDEAFEGLARARAHAEANLQNAREFFDNALLAMMAEIDQDSPRLSLSDAAIDFGRGRSRHRPRNAPFLYGGPYPFIQTGDIRNASGRLTEFSQTYSEEGLSQSKLWPAGTVCITIAANIAETAVMCFEGCFPDSVIGMVPDDQVTLPEYVEYMLRFFAADLKAQGKGSAQDNINLATFEKATFPFPPIDQQREVVSKLDDLWSSSSDLVTAYSNKIDDIDDLRQSLLQKAFTGELTRAEAA